MKNLWTVHVKREVLEETLKKLWEWFTGTKTTYYILFHKSLKFASLNEVSPKLRLFS